MEAGRGVIQPGYSFNLKTPDPATIHRKKIISIWPNKICERETSASGCPLTKEQVLLLVGWLEGGDSQLMSPGAVRSLSVIIMWKSEFEVNTNS